MDGYKILTFRSSLILFLLVFLKESLSLIVTQVRLVSPLAYVLHGEPAVLNCQFIIEPTEVVTEVEWEKDGVHVYLWQLGQASQAKDVLVDHVDLGVTSPGQLSITNATMNMDGTYTCRVRTNGKIAQNDMHLMVIVDACKESAWKTHSDMIECTETVSMHCIGVYPKPSPACGVYSEKTGRFLNSVPFDSTNKLSNGTYEVSFNRRFAIQEWINHTDISFRCHMMVLGTTWRSGIKHKMFGEAGCLEEPPHILDGYYNITENRSCWGYPSEDSVLEYHCNEGFNLIGSELFICSGGKWTPDGVVADTDHVFPICSDSNGSVYHSLNRIMGLLIALSIWTFLS